MTTPRRAGRPGDGDHPPPFIIILCRTLIIIPAVPSGARGVFRPGPPVRQERTQLVPFQCSTSVCSGGFLPDSEQTHPVAAGNFGRR